MQAIRNHIPPTPRRFGPALTLRLCQWDRRTPGDLTKYAASEISRCDTHPVVLERVQHPQT